MGWLSYLSICLSGIALFISFAVGYNTVLKPFALTVRIDPNLQMQHKINLGLYLHVDFFNNSPKNGQVTEAALILYKVGSEEDKYLLTLLGFRVVGEDGVWSESEERLPLFFKPWQRQTKSMNFLHLIEEQQFPLASGTYLGELLIWTRYEAQPRYVEHFKFNVSGDLLKAYMQRKELGSTTLEPLTIVGYTPLKSKKLTDEEYKRLH